MHISHHADQRMNQRGISRRLVEFTLSHGRVEGDKHVLDRKESRRLIESLTEQLRLAKRIMDKGGVVVVEGESDTVVTTYNVDVPMRRPKTHPCVREVRCGAGAGKQGRIYMST
jgi:hypothetical protein